MTTIKSKIVMVIKCLQMLYKPLPAVILACLFWYFVFYKNQIFLKDDGEIIVTWISMFGILYGLLAAVVLSTVWTEYKAMRTAVKRYDFDTFSDLRDEEISPLVHTLMFVISGMILVAFMLLRYANMGSAIMFIASTTYLFVLLFLVIYEIDDPCAGTWYIKNIPKEWLEIDIKRFREEERYKKGREAFEAKRKYGRRWDDPKY